MATTITDYLDVRERARQLNLPMVAEFSILPRSFSTAASESDLRHENDASTVRKLFTQAGLDAQMLEPPQRLPASVEKSVEWIAPTIFIGSMLWSQNQYAVQVALNVLSSYIFNFLKGRLPTGKVRVSFVIEASKSKTFKQLTYEGPVSGLTELAATLRQLRDE